MSKLSEQQMSIWLVKVVLPVSLMLALDGINEGEMHSPHIIWLGLSSEMAYCEYYVAPYFSGRQEFKRLGVNLVYVTFSNLV